MLLTSHSLENKQPLAHYVSMQCLMELNKAFAFAHAGSGTTCKVTCKELPFVYNTWYGLSECH